MAARPHVALGDCCSSRPTRLRHIRHSAVCRPPRALHIQEEIESTPQLQRAAAWAALHSDDLLEHTVAGPPAGDDSSAALNPLVASTSRLAEAPVILDTDPTIYSHLATVGVVAAGCSAVWHCHGTHSGFMLGWAGAAVSAIAVVAVALLMRFRSSDGESSLASSVRTTTRPTTAVPQILADIRPNRVSAPRPEYVPRRFPCGSAEEGTKCDDEEEVLLVQSLSPSNLQALDELCKECTVILRPSNYPQHRQLRPFLRRATLARYLRARSDDVGKAKAMLQRSLDWRSDIDVWGPLSLDVETASMAWLGAAGNVHPQPSAARVAARYWYGGIHGTDRRGAPVVYTRFGTGDPARLANLCEAVGEVADLGGVKTDQSLMRQSVAMCEAFQAICTHLSKARGEHLDTFIEVIDLGADGEPGWFRRAMAASRHFAAIAKTLDNNYPERVHKVFIVRAPVVFASIWRMVSPLVDAGTKAKISIYVSITKFVIVMVWRLAVTNALMRRLGVLLLTIFHGRTRCGRLLKTIKYLAIWVVHATALTGTTAAPPSSRVGMLCPRLRY